jgi:hypothetical protein
MEFGTKTVSRTCRKIWERKFAGAAAIGKPKREGLFLPQKGDGHCRQAAKESRLGATLAGKHEVGVTQKELDGSGIFQNCAKNRCQNKRMPIKGKGH